MVSVLNDIEPVYPHHGFPFKFDDMLKFIVNSIPPVLLITVAAFNYHDCEAIPRLTLFLMISGCLLFSEGFIQFWFHLPYVPPHPTTCVMWIRHIMQIGVVGCLVWGAVITIGEASDRFPDGGVNCTSTAFNTALVYIALTLGVSTLAICLGVSLAFSIICCPYRLAPVQECERCEVIDNNV